MDEERETEEMLSNMLEALPPFEIKIPSDRSFTTSAVKIPAFGQ